MKSYSYAKNGLTVKVNPKSLRGKSKMEKVEKGKSDLAKNDLDIFKAITEEDTEHFNACEDCFKAHGCKCDAIDCQNRNHARQLSAEHDYGFQTVQDLDNNFKRNFKPCEHLRYYQDGNRILRVKSTVINYVVIEGFRLAFEDCTLCSKTLSLSISSAMSFKSWHESQKRKIRSDNR